MSYNLFVFEGIDGSGKSTLVNNVYNQLSKKYSVKLIKFPTVDSKLTNVIQDLLNGKVKLDYESTALLFELDRYLYKDTLYSYLENYDFVLLDRYVYSNLAYQGAKLLKHYGFDKLKEFINKFKNLAFEQFQLPIPNSVFVCNTPLELTSKNLLSKERDVHEFDMELQFGASIIYTDILPKHFSNLITINMTENGSFKKQEFLTNEIIFHIANLYSNVLI